jgi:cobalt-zinc-cadmium resistance protein CzcA
MPFSISAGVGFIVLFGVAVLNGLVLINRFNSLKEEGITSIKDRILTGTKERIRPIMLTATTDIFGFLPMAFSASAGAEVQRPLATVVIGGMLSATLLTLVVLPVLYTLVEGRSDKKKSLKAPSANVIIALIVFGGLFGVPAVANAQQQGQEKDSLPTITLEQARKRAIKSYPKIQSARLEIESQQALKKTAWDFGNTQVFTGKEEVGNGSDGVYTQFGIQQQQIDIFGIAPKLKLQKEQVALAKSALDLSMIELEKEVSQAWAMVYASKNNFQIYVQLDSIFTDIERAAKIRLETEATSKLEYLATSNQANQVQIQKEQAYRDYLSALQRLNLWFANDTLFTVPDIPATQLDDPLNYVVDSLMSHPLLNVSTQQVKVADATIKERRSQFLPKLQGQYGRQQIAGQSGFYQYQVGIRIPLFFGPELGQTQAAKIQRDIAGQNLRQNQLELKAAYQGMKEQYLKWLNSWNYYRDEALPLAQEQRKGAVTAYREGAIDYVTFLQNIRDAIRIEVDSWDAFGNYLDSRYQLEYYLKTSTKN